MLVFVLLIRFKDIQIPLMEKEIAKMKEEAEQECKAIKKEAILEAKEQDLKLRNEFERETKEKRIEFQKMEQRLAQKDDVLNKRDANLLKKNEELEQQKQAQETPPPPEFNAVNEPQTPPPALNDFSQTPPPYQQPINPHFLPGMVPSGQVPAPPGYYAYNQMPNPYQYPPPPAEQPTREEFNWTIASLIALIVLVMQLFYIILQMK